MARRKYSQEEKQTHVELWEESDISRRQYALESNICYKSFLEWVTLYSKRPSQESDQEKFLAIEIEEGSTTKANTQPEIEIHYPNGVKLYCPTSIDINKLRKLI